jgi:hypothetical protein
VLIGTATLAIIAGRCRSKYDGTEPRIWWREQRMHRTPASIAWRATRRRPPSAASPQPSFMLRCRAPLEL